MTAPEAMAAALSAEDVARLFHEAYERLAPDYGYETRRESAVPWDDVPEPNRSLMVAVAGKVLTAITFSQLAALEASGWVLRRAGEAACPAARHHRVRTTRRGSLILGWETDAGGEGSGHRAGQGGVGHLRRLRIRLPRRRPGPRAPR